MYRMKDFTPPLLLEYASKGEFHIADQTRRHPLAVEMTTPDPSGKIGHQHQGNRRNEQRPEHQQHNQQRDDLSVKGRDKQKLNGLC